MDRQLCSNHQEERWRTDRCLVRQLSRRHAGLEKFIWAALKVVKGTTGIQLTAELSLISDNSRLRPSCRRFAPDQSTGGSSAAESATDLIGSFPSRKAGMLVNLRYPRLGASTAGAAPTRLSSHKSGAASDSDPRSGNAIDAGPDYC